MTYRRAILIYNPAAGRRLGRRLRIEPVLAALGRGVETVEAAPTTGPGVATELGRRAGLEGFDLVAVCGGDGTVNEVANGLVGGSVPLAVLPAGTANVLALELGLARDPERAAAAVPHLEPLSVSLGRLRPAGAPERYFLLMAGAGLDASIVRHLDLRLKSRLGILSYWWAGAGELGRPRRPFQVTFDGRRLESTFALAALSSYYGGGLRLARRAHLLSGRLELVLFHSRSTTRYLVYLAAAACGRLEQLPDVTFSAAGRLTMTNQGLDPVYVQVDGELAGRLPAEIELVPAALTLLAPPAYRGAHG